MLVLMGKSCSGKDTIIAELVKRGWKRVVTYTTRPMREGEVDGVNYHFIDNDTFNEMITAKEFVEYKSYNTEFGVWMYGVAIENVKNSDEKSVVTLTPAGYEDAMFCEAIKDVDIECIYVKVSDEELLRRLESRGDDKSEAQRRFIADMKDFETAEALADSYIRNEDRSVRDVVDEIERFHEERKHSSSMQVEKIESFKVDHTKLVPGIYISRIDGDVVTYDLRVKKPNNGDYLSNIEMHSFEHMFATYVRSLSKTGQVIYFGPMGCQTGFYLLVRNLSEKETLELVKNTLEAILKHYGDVFGASERECGNYRNLSLTAAERVAVRYLGVILDKKDIDKYEE